MAFIFSPVSVFSVKYDIDMGTGGPGCGKFEAVCQELLLIYGLKFFI